MPKENTVAVNIEALTQEIRQNRDEIVRLKREIEQLKGMLGAPETEELEDQLDKEEELEFGTINNSVIKGRVNWTNAYLISISTADEGSDGPSEVLIFKQALAYIRKSEEKLVSHRGMYV